MTSTHSKIVDELKLSALSLEVGKTTNIICPSCDGGTHDDVSLSLTRIAEGILYNCYRDSCALGGGFISSQTGAFTPNDNKRKKTIKKFTHSLRNLSQDELTELYSRYGIHKEKIKGNGWKRLEEYHTLYMPILNKEGYEIGCMTKKLAQHADNRPKNVLYLTNQSAPRLHYPMQNFRKEAPLYIVEDMISATRLTSCVNSVALLGTSMCDKQVLDILSITNKVILMLDADTWEHKTPTPVKLRNKYGIFFKYFVLVYIPKDIKDMKEVEFLNLMGKLHGKEDTQRDNS